MIFLGKVYGNPAGLNIESWQRNHPLSGDVKASPVGNLIGSRAVGYTYTSIENTNLSLRTDKWGPRFF